MMNLFYHLAQEGRAQQAASSAEIAASKAERVSFDVSTLSRKIETLSLACQAMWELIRDNTKLTDEKKRWKIKLLK